MTVQNQLPPTNTNGDGTTVTFGFDFKIQREEFLKVIQTIVATGEETELSIISSTGIGNPAGGTITVDTAPPTGSIVSVDSNVDFEQQVELDGNDLYPPTVEEMIDAVVIQNQGQETKINRSVRVPVSDGVVPSLPAKAQRADKILGFTADGSDFLMVEGAAASQAYVDLAEAQADRAVAATTYPYTSGEQKTGAFMPGTDESLTLFTYNNASAAAATLPAMSGITASYNIGIGRTAGSGDVTISADDGALINGASSIVLNSDYLCLDLKPNEAGDEWVARDKVAIGVPIGTEAGNIVALDDDAKLPALDGSLLTNIRDQYARDIAISTLAYKMAEDDAAAISGPIGVLKLVDNFQTDTLLTKSNAVHDGVNYRYRSDSGFTDSASVTHDANVYAGYQGYSMRQKIAAAQISGSGSNIKIKFAADTTRSFNIDKCYIGHAAASGNAWDFDGNQVQVTFSTGSAGFTLTSGQTITSDEIAFSLDDSKDLIVAFDWSTGGTLGARGKASQTGWSVYEKNTSGTDESQDSTPAGYSSGSSGVAGVEAVQVESPVLDMVFRPVATTVSAAVQSVLAYFMVIEIDSLTLETDINLKASIDGYSTLETATLWEVGEVGDSGRILIGAMADVSAQSGTSLGYSVESDNGKDFYFTDFVGAAPIY
ncbi:MAG: hypothetical protein RIG26_15010 [Thalassospira sp.]|uniref:hypothetical protein n=1 Tax=Thalassospira sp. TaxID=1912094 RepID=UPI0032EB1C5A